MSMNKEKTEITFNPTYLQKNIPHSFCQFFTTKKNHKLMIVNLLQTFLKGYVQSSWIRNKLITPTDNLQELSRPKQAKCNEKPTFFL